MKIETQIKLNSNPLYKKYIKEHSYWYKNLKRNPERIDEFIKNMKKDYKLRTTDKIDNFVDSVDLIAKIFKVTNE